jgi:hypothetical protein
LSTSNQEAMAGWIGLTTSFTFASAITGVATSIVATPTFSPAAGTYTSAQSVTLSTSISGASIYYNTDGSTPTPLSLLYVGAITVDYPQTIKAIGVLPGLANSAVASAAYTIRNSRSVGLASTNGTAATTLSTTVDVAAGLVVVKVWSDTLLSSVTFGGASMTLAVAQAVGSAPSAGNVSQYYLACSEATSVSVLATAGSAANMQMEIVNVTGLTNNTIDNSGATKANASGDSSTPSTGATPTSATADAVAVAVFATKTPGGSITWAGTPTFLTDDQDVTDVISSTTYVLTGASYVASATGTFTAALSGITPAKWGGSVVVYS